MADRAITFIRARIHEEDCGHTTPCWLWTGYKNEKGYGRSYVPGFGPNKRIHRVAYELFVGPIPDGLQIDHLCCVKACVNPEHLEAVTNTENDRRARAAGLLKPPPIQKKTHCLRGHALTPENRTTTGSCRLCHRRHVSEWARRNPEKRRENNRRCKARQRAEAGVG